MTGEFDRATAVQRLDEVGPGGTTRFSAEIHDGWDIGGNANGGYLLAVAARAMAAVAGRPPLTVTAHYLPPAPAGACTLDVALLRAGRRMATITASLTQDARPVMEVLGTFGDQIEDDRRLIDGAPPALPPYDECVLPAAATEGPRPALNERLAVRMRPGDDGFRRGEPTGTPEFAGWFAFADERPVDAIALMLVADAFPPPVFNTALPVAWVPTLELTVHVRGVPAPGPLRCTFRSRFVQGGLVEEDGEVWDSRDVLVCQSRQLSLTPRG
jgi:hypothetical protein